MITKLEPAPGDKYKWVATFSDGSRVRFGAKGYTDWTLGATPEQRDAYRSRHAKDLKTRDPKKPGYLSMYILWGDSRDVRENVRAYNRRFF